MKKYLFYYLLVFTVITGFYLIYSYSQLFGDQYIYPIDDAYIHLAIAKNFGLHGFWSINLDSFDSASSSILYTLILSSLIRFFGDSLYYPIVINILAGYGIVYWVYRYFKEFCSEQALWLGLIFLFPMTILHSMVMIGMEQTLHMLLSVMALYYFRKCLNSHFLQTDFSKLLMVILLLGMVRFESMFFVLVFGSLLIGSRRYKEGFMVLGVGFLPIVIFGWISLKAGGYFFPNSVLIKGSYPAGNILMGIWAIVKKGILINPSFYKLFLFPLVCFRIYFYQKYKEVGCRVFFEKEQLFLLVFGTLILQSLFGIIMHRYENYVMVMLLMILIPAIVDYQKNFSFQKSINYLFLISFVGFCAVSFYRFAYYHPVAMVASKNIEEQQLQMGEFLNRYYKGEKVVANDIGAIAYLGNVQLLDIVGLGSTDVTRFLVEHKGLEPKELDHKKYQFLTDYIARHQYKVAVIYPDWYPESIPSSWVPVASWKIENNRGTAEDTVVWYALNPDQVPRLKKALLDFELNPNVYQRFY